MSLLDRILRQQPKTTTNVIRDDGGTINIPDAPDSRAVSLVKTAGVSLTKNGIVDRRAAVYLVLDHSGSMSRYYANGSVQNLAEQSLGLAVNLDDDGRVPVVFFQSRAHKPKIVRIGDHSGAVERMRHGIPYGSTNYAAAMRAVISHHDASTGPALVMFQTDGEPDSEYEARQIIKDSSRLPIFWQFIGFGHDSPFTFSFLRSLDSMTGRHVDNAGFFAAGERPADMPDEILYDNITGPFAQWLTDATRAGVL